MPLSDFISIDISLADPPAALADFSVPLIATTLSAPQIAAFGSPRTMALTPSTWQAAMTLVGVSSSEDPYIAFRTLFSQDVKPARAIWGRRATAVAQVVRFTIAAGPHTLTFTATINGVPHQYIAAGATADVVRDALIAAINGGSQAALVTAASAGVGLFDVTSDVPGLSFTFSATNSVGTPMTAAITTPNTGLAEDVAAIRVEDDSWYLLLENLRSDAALIEGALALEALGENAPKLLIGQTLDPDAQGTASLTDLGSRLAALSLVRTALVWNDDSDEWIDAALVGRVGPTPPGSNTWANQVLRSVSGPPYASVLTNPSRLRSKRYTWLEPFTAAGFSMTQGGRTVTGIPIDIVIGRDWLKNLQQIRIAEALRNNPKIPYTNDGGAAIGDVIRGTLLEAAAAPHNFIVESTIKITVPKATAQSSTDRGNRHFPGVTWQATAQGAIESLDIGGTITQ